MSLQVDTVLKKINKYTSEPEFTPEAVGKVSGAARGLCLWVRENQRFLPSILNYDKNSRLGLIK